MRCLLLELVYEDRVRGRRGGAGRATVRILRDITGQALDGQVYQLVWMHKEIYRKPKHEAHQSI